MRKFTQLAAIAAMTGTIVLGSAVSASADDALGCTGTLLVNGPHSYYDPVPTYSTGGIGQVSVDASGTYWFTDDLVTDVIDWVNCVG